MDLLTGMAVSSMYPNQHSSVALLEIIEFNEMLRSIHASVHWISVFLPEKATVII